MKRRPFSGNPRAEATTETGALDDLPNRATRDPALQLLEPSAFYLISFRRDLFPTPVPDRALHVTRTYDGPKIASIDAGEGSTV